MRKFWLFLTVFVIVFLSSDAVWAKGGKKGKAGGESKGRADSSRRLEHGQGTDVNSDTAKMKREEMEKLRQERLRLREKRRQGQAGQEDVKEFKKRKREVLEGGEKGLKKGAEHKQQINAFEKQMMKHNARHSERLARLKRIRTLATEQGKTDTVERIDKLIEKETSVYSRKLDKLKGKSAGEKKADKKKGGKGDKGKAKGDKDDDDADEQEE